MKDSLIDNYCLFGLEALRARLPAISQEADGVRLAEDIECVHRMRVASRRARNALALFGECLSHKHYESWRKDLRRITRALGAARDLDVQISWVEDFLNHAAEESWRVGITRLLLRLRQERARQQVQVIQALDQLSAIDDMVGTLHEMIVHARVYEIDSLPADLYQRAYEAILLRLEEFLAFEPFVAFPERTNELHQMRIAAKHLRYTLEVFAPLYKGELKRGLKVVKEIQELLGEFHDCDVWLTFLAQFLEEERARTLEYFGEELHLVELTPGIHALQDDRARRRQERYEVFARFWKLTKKYDIWNDLRGIIKPQEEHASEFIASETNDNNTDTSDESAEESPIDLAAEYVSADNA